jgi:DNA (cytosine-5)-methyltransferase 1
MRYLSICSGIEAASVAWHPLGWEPVGFAEIEPFPSAVLAHHWPDVPNLGDMTNFHAWNIARPDLLVGGTPCQAFSVAGLRKGLADARGNLSLVFCEMADHFDPEWVIWENVPGVLSSKDNAFGCFLAGLCGADDPLVPNGKWSSAGVVSGPKRTVAWRVLDAQFFGVAQRRRRVFVLAVRGAGNFRCAEALFPVGEGVFWDSPPRREAGQGSTYDIAPCIAASGRGFERTGDTRGQDCLIPHTVGSLCADSHPIAFSCKDHGFYQPAVATDLYNGAIDGDVTHSIQVGNGNAMGGVPSAITSMQVRRLTPTECERLQGFPDGHTLIPWRNKPAEDCPDGPRYKALGNSMAVPVMRWIGERIQTLTNIG